VIKLQGKLPREIYLACSGGVDSMVAYNFLSRNHDVILLYYHHGTEHGARALEFLEAFAKERNVGLLSNYLSSKDNFSAFETTPSKHKRESQEEYWRRIRYDWLERCTNRQIVTAHHLDDCVETWLMSSMHGTGKIVPYSRNNRVIRPFLLNRKRDLRLWARLNNIDYIEDESNADTTHLRNYIRHDLMPHVLHINPGIYKTIRKKVLKQCQNQEKLKNLVQHSMTQLEMTISV